MVFKSHLSPTPVGVHLQFPPQECQVQASGIMLSCPWLLFTFGEEEHVFALLVSQSGAPCLYYSPFSHLWKCPYRPDTALAPFSTQPSRQLLPIIRLALEPQSLPSLSMKALDLPPTSWVFQDSDIQYSVPV